MLNRIIAIIAALFTAFVVIMVLESVAHHYFPFPEGSNFKSPQELQKALELLPLGASIIILIAYAAGSFAAGAVLKLIAEEKNMFLAFVAGTILTLAGIFNQMVIPHPTWFMLTALFMYVPFTYLGFLLTKPIKKEHVD